MICLLSFRIFGAQSMEDILEFLKPNEERENTLRGKEYLRIFLSKKNPPLESIRREKTFLEEAREQELLQKLSKRRRQI